MSRRLKLCCCALAWIAASVVATLLIANLSLGTKEFDKPLQRLFTVDSPQFHWVMSAALTPPMLGGYQVDARSMPPPRCSSRSSSSPFRQ